MSARSTGLADTHNSGRSRHAQVHEVPCDALRLVSQLTARAPDDDSVRGCERPLAWAIEVGSLRCFPQPEDGGIVSPEDMTEVAVNQYLDGRALHDAIHCCGLTTALETYVPVGPAGGCVGGFWQAYLDDPR